MSESFAKKEKAKLKAKQKQDKAAKMKERKSNEKKGKTLEEMMAYLDENGNITSTPPTGVPRMDINLEDIQLGAAPIIKEIVQLTGTVSFFNTEKGYGFITEDDSRENIFVHHSELIQPIKESDRVTFEKEKSKRGGYNAIRVSIVKS